MRKHAWILLFALLACWISGCGGGGGSSSNGIEPSPDDYILSALNNGNVVRWTEPIPVYMNQVNVPADWKQADVTFFLDAMDEWANASQKKLSFETQTSPSDPCITVRWVKDHPLGQDPPTIGGSQLHTSTFGGKTYIQRVEIELAVDGSTGSPLADNIMRLLSIHELGHAIGIWGHSDNPNDIMYPELGSQTGLSTRDINTINRLYTLTPNVTQLPQSKIGITPEETGIFTMP